MTSVVAFVLDYWHLFALLATLIVTRRWLCSRAGGRVTLLSELLLVWAAILCYFLVRGMVIDDAETAFANADLLIRLERDLGIFVEPQAQLTAMRHDVAMHLLNWFYVWLYWPIVLTGLLWLCLRHPDEYLLYRNGLLISGAIGLAIFALFPVAPPRFLGDLGFVDTVERGVGFSNLMRPPSLTNHYAAMPSFHLGWNFLISLAIMQHAGSRWARHLAVLSPALMFAAIVATGNHYIIDGVAGCLVALAGLSLANAWADRPATRTKTRELARATS